MPLLLVGPLVLFMLAFYALPVVAMLMRSVCGFFSHTVCVATTWRNWLPPANSTAL